MARAFWILPVGFLILLGGISPKEAGDKDGAWAGELSRETRVETAAERLSRRCGQCHRLKIEGVCVTKDCSSDRVKETPSREWGKFLVWVRDLLDCPLTPQDVAVLSDYLNRRFPSPGLPDSVPWVAVQTLRNAWNVVSLQDLDGWLYAGVEGNKARIFRSRDGSRWEQVAETEAIAIYGLTKFKGAYYAGGNEPTARIFKSADGRSWNVASALDGEIGILSMGIFGDSLFAGTAEGRIYRSEDGRRWEVVARIPTRGEPNWVRSLVAFKGNFYAFAEQGDIFRSGDGKQWMPVNWLPAPYKTPRRLRPATVFQDSLFVGTLSHGEIWKSRDGETWELVYDVTPGRTSGSDRGYVGSLKVAGQALLAGISVGFGSGKIFRTFDGVKWDDLGLISPHTIESLEYFNGSVFAGTLIPPDTRIFRSSDPRIFSPGGRRS